MTGDLTPTTTLGRYHLEKRIARGGMGELWLARAQGAAGWEKYVAVKTILPHLSDRDELVERFLDEANIATTLSHGNIVPVFELGQDGDTWFLVMEYVDGWDLRAILRRARAHGAKVPEALALYIVAQICQGLEYAHNRKDELGRDLNIVHRDISPANILISRDGDVRIVDFGIATAKRRINQTMTGELRGKFAYMSPEQASGQVVDRRSDLFSLGVVLYEILAGVRPFDGDSDMEVLGKVQRAQYEPLAQRCPEVSSEVCAIVDKALAPDAHERFQSAHEFQLAVLHALQQREQTPLAPDLATFCLQFDRPTWSTGNTSGPSFDALLREQLEALEGGSESGTPSFVTPSEGRGATRTAARVLTAPSYSESSGSDRAPVSIRRATPTPFPALAAVDGGGERSAETQTVRVDRRLIVRRKRLWWAIGVVTLLIVVTSVLAFRAGTRSAASGPLVRITTAPEGALISFNGVSYGRSTLVARLEPGEFVVRAELEGHEAQERALIYDGREDLALHLPLVALPPAPAADDTPLLVAIADGAPEDSGESESNDNPPDELEAEPAATEESEVRVRISGLPANATLSVDGAKQSSTTSARIPRRANVILRAEAPGFQRLELRVDGRSVDRSLSMTLVPAETGTLTVRFIGSILTGEVLVNGRSYGFNERSPRTQLSLPEGNFRVTVRNPELGKVEEHEIRIRAGEERVLRIDW